MKQLLFLNLIIATLSTSVQAATISISAYADVFLGTNENATFSQSPGGTPLELAELETLVTSGIDTFVLSDDTAARIDLGFGDNTVITGSGSDLVIFTVGNDYSFGLEVFGVGGILLSSQAYNVPTPTDLYDATLFDTLGNPLCVNDADPCPAVLSGTAIDLLNIADNTEISYISVWIGSSYNGSNGDTPLFALAGATHTVVPLPLPAILFSSGLFLLGWVGRRKST